MHLLLNAMPWCQLLFLWNLVSFARSTHVCVIKVINVSFYAYWFYFDQSQNNQQKIFMSFAVTKQCIYFWSSVEADVKEEIPCHTYMRRPSKWHQTSQKEQMAPRQSICSYYVCIYKWCLRLSVYLTSRKEALRTKMLSMMLSLH